MIADDKHDMISSEEDLKEINRKKTVPTSILLIFFPEKVPKNLPHFFRIFPIEPHIFSHYNHIKKERDSNVRKDYR